jgi:release factor glutamine methyltransferase
LFAWGKGRLNHVTSQAFLETVILLSFVLQTSHTHLLAHLESSISDVQERKFRALIQRRCQGEPIAYLTHSCEFWSLPLMITSKCLIPRPETELLVEKVLAYYPQDEIIRVADLGTGSGAIAVALSLERPHWEIIATDQSIEALQIAQHNAKCLGANVKFRQGDWFKTLSRQESFHAIISNSPYLAEQDIHLKDSLRYEPQMALIGGQQGTEILHYLIQHALPYLASGGRLWLEQGFDQAPIVKTYLKQYGYTTIQQYSDLAGIIRASSGCVSPV